MKITAVAAHDARCTILAYIGAAGGFVSYVCVLLNIYLSLHFGPALLNSLKMVAQLTSNKQCAEWMPFHFCAGPQSSNRRENEIKPNKIK